MLIHTAHRPHKGEPRLLVTNRSDLDNIVIAYRHRWSIETHWVSQIQTLPLESRLTKPQDCIF